MQKEITSVIIKQALRTNYASDLLYDLKTINLGENLKVGRSTIKLKSSFEYQPS